MTVPPDPVALWLRECQGPASPTLEEFLQRCPLPEPSDVLGVFCADQRRSWRAGQPRPVEEYLRLRPELGTDAEALLELVYNEYVCRRDRGEHPDLHGFLARFPAVAEALRRQLLVDDLFAEDETQDRPAPAETLDSSLLPPPQPAPAAVPAQLGRYPVLALLGSGGQGAVYRGSHPLLQREVVIKVTRPGSAIADPQALLAEGRLLADLDHPNLARIYDIDLHAGRPFLVMEYIRGRTLAQAAADRPFPPAKAARLVAAVARGLDYAHRRGIVHGDVKPQNIVLDPEGRPRLIDFGLARLRDPWQGDDATDGLIRGTLEYMAPEQATGKAEQITAQTDVFALGGVLYFLLTRRPPFPGTTLSDSLRRITEGAWDREPLRARGIPARLAAVCQQALALRPEDRPASAGALAEALERAGRPWRRGPLVAGAVLAVLLAGVGLFWVLRSGPPAGTSGPPGGTPVAAPAVSEPADLTVAAWVGDRYVELPEPAPLRDGMRLRIEAEVPAGLHAALFSFGTSGHLTELAQGQVTATSPRLRHVARLGGPPGTEIVLLCARADRPTTRDEVEACCDATTTWPALPGGSVLRLSGARVKIVQRRRDLVAVPDQADPEDDVRQRLEALGRRLGERFPVVEAVAFAHRP
jgi:predicted Ser/Thr protein kinase